MPATGKDIQRFLRSRGIKQQEVAASMGVNAQTISQYLNMAYPPERLVAFVTTEYGYTPSDVPMLTEAEDIKRFLKAKNIKQDDVARDMQIARQTFIRYLQRVDVPEVLRSFLQDNYGYQYGAWAEDSNITEQAINATAIGQLGGGEIEKDKSGNEFIDLKGGQYLMIVPLVEEYAQAGYVSGFADQSFIEDLPKHSIIVQQRHRGDYVAFRISGDSMDDESYRAIRDGDIAVGRKIDKIHWQSRFHLHKFTDYIIVHKEGIIIKSIAYHDVEKGTILCESRNPDKTRYPNYEINLSEVNEILNVVSIDRPWK